MSSPASRPHTKLPPLESIDDAAESSNLHPDSFRAPPQNDATTSIFLTVEELAELLRLNRKTVYDALARGDIPGARRVGGTYRILRDAVLSWFASGQGCVSRSRRKRR